jgi:hypothetical protein
VAEDVEENPPDCVRPAEDVADGNPPDGVGGELRRSVFANTAASEAEEGAIGNTG